MQRTTKIRSRGWASERRTRWTVTGVGAKEALQHEQIKNVLAQSPCRGCWETRCIWRELCWELSPYTVLTLLHACKANYSFWKTQECSFGKINQNQSFGYISTLHDATLHAHCPSRQLCPHLQPFPLFLWPRMSSTQQRLNLIQPSCCNLSSMTISVHEQLSSFWTPHKARS